MTKKNVVILHKKHNGARKDWVDNREIKFVFDVEHDNIINSVVKDRCVKSNYSIKVGHIHHQGALKKTITIKCGNIKQYAAKTAQCKRNIDSVSWEHSVSSEQISKHSDTGKRFTIVSSADPSGSPKK